MKNTIQLLPPFQTFANGLTLHQTASSGEVTDGVGRDGAPRRLAYAAGSLVLADAEGSHVAGPIDASAAEALAQAVIEGEPAALRLPGLSQRLAMIVLALFAEGSTPQAAASRQEARHV